MGKAFREDEARRRESGFSLIFCDKCCIWENGKQGGAFWPKRTRLVAERNERKKRAAGKKRLFFQKTNGAQGGASH